MIFDSPKMITLREKYHNTPNYGVPEIVNLDRIDEYTGERSLLESLLLDANESRRKDWLGRLINIEDAQFWGAWFEIMLYGMA